LNKLPHNINYEWIKGWNEEPNNEWARQEIEEKNENLKKDLDEKFEFSLIDDKMEDSPEDKMDIHGHSQAWKHLNIDMNINKSGVEASITFPFP
jgi:hypothetical protein